MTSSNDREPLLGVKTEQSAAESGGSVLRKNNYIICCGIPIRLGIVCACLALVNIVTSAGMTVTLPIYVQTVVSAGSDPFNLLLVATFWTMILYIPFFFGYKFIFNRSMNLRPDLSLRLLLLLGLLMTLGSDLSVFSSDPLRTPSYLQAILGTSTIPATVVLRYAILRKGVSRQRLVCAGVVLVGLFITLEPQIWNLDGSGHGTTESAAGRIVWPLCFMASLIPGVVSSVIQEREIKSDQINVMNFIMWMAIAQFFMSIAFFWSDLIPGFGMATSPADVWHRFTTGLRCHFGTISTCTDVIWASWLFNLIYTLSSFPSFLLLKYSDGVIYVAVVNALVTPIGALFWSLFKAEPYFHWQPSFTQTTAFTLAGLALMMPAVVAYGYLSQQEAAEEYKRNHFEKDATISDPAHIVN